MWRTGRKAGRIRQSGDTILAARSWRRRCGRPSSAVESPRAASRQVQQRSASGLLSTGTRRATHETVDTDAAVFGPVQSGARSQVMRLTLTTLVALLIWLAHHSAIAGSGDTELQREVLQQITASEAMRGTRIEVHVSQDLVVLTGTVRLYEQRLVAERIAWTAPGVFEVDNEIQVLPLAPLTDGAIKRKIHDILRTYPRFHSVNVTIDVENGNVFVQGRFLAIADPTFLKHQVARIEGVLDVRIRAEFIARRV